MGGAGSLSLSAVSEDYWNSERNMQSLSAGYNNSWNGISYGFNYSYNRNSQAIYGDSDRGNGVFTIATNCLPSISACHWRNG